MFPVMNTKKKREKRKCCPFICCAAVEDDVEVTQESRLPTFKKLAGKASMAQLGNRLDLNNTHEETMVDPDLDSDTEVTVVFQSPIESISGMDKQIVQMQSAVKCSFMESSSDGAAVRMCLRELFDITKGTYFSYIQDELIRSMRSMVPQEMWAAVNVHTTFSLISSIYEDVLKKINSALLETNILTESWRDSVVPQIMDMAKTLQSSTMKKLQDFLEICRVCGWLRASRGAPVDILDELDAVVPTLTRKVVGAIFQSLLSISSEGTSKDVMDCGSDTPLNNFLQAVADKIESEIFSESATPKQSSCPCDSSVVEETPSSQGRDDFDRKERREVATCSVVTEKLLNSHRPRCESVLESIILNNLNQNSDADSTERDTQRLLRLSVHAFLDESSNIVNHIIKNETTEITRTSPVFDSTLESSMVAAAAGVVSALVSDLKSTFQEDFKLADPSLDPTLYTTQIQLVSDKVLESIQPKLKEVLITNILMRVNGVMKTEYDAQLSSNLLTASRETLKIIIEAIMAILRRFNVTDSILLYRRFLWDLQEHLILPSQYLSECSDVSSEDSFVEELYSRPRFPRIRLPKLRFKKQNNRMEATTVLTEDQTQNQPLPTEKPSNASTTSAAVPKRKTFFSRVSAAFCRVFRKGAKTSA